MKPTPVQLRVRAVLTIEEREKRKEKSDAHRAFKLLKSLKYISFTEKDKTLLKKYYGIET